MGWNHRSFMVACVSASLALTLIACGGGGGGGGKKPTVSEPPRQTALAFPRAVEQHYLPDPFTTPASSEAKHMPVYGNGRHLMVGVDQGTNVGRLPKVGKRSDTSIRYGSLVDRVGRSVVSNYLADVTSSVRRYGSAPIVRVIGQSNARERERVAAAVQLVNTALPEDTKISIAAALPSFSLRDTIQGQGRRFVSGQEIDGTIHVEFLSCSDYHGCGQSGGTTWNHSGQYQGDVQNSYVQISRGSSAYADDRNATILLAHEIMHALGLYGGNHVSPSFDSIMEAGNQIFATSQGSPQPLSLLYPVDREALQALYGRLESGDSHDDFGPWASASWHISGVGQHAAFGVAIANGYAEPWAYGLRPNISLANNRSLSGSATWAGTLVGFTPSSAPVIGDAEIGVNLSTMRGTADFTSLERWPAGATPGSVGTGTMWGDGDLTYSISVRGNTFRETGGDDGRLTGIFTGASHEGAAGVLQRSDLTASFGAER